MRRIRNGFTLIELVIVITVIGILAALVIPKYAGAQTDTSVVAAGEDLLGMAKAFEYFNANNGYWPAETQAGVMPPEVRTVFKREDPFKKICPINGIYDYDFVRSKSKVTISIAIRGSAASPAPTVADAQALDQFLDDGVLNTGNFQTINGGYSYTFFKR